MAEAVEGNLVKRGAIAEGNFAELTETPPSSWPRYVKVGPHSGAKLITSLDRVVHRVNILGIAGIPRAGNT